MKIFKSRPSTVLRVARLQRVHDTINQTEKRTDKTLSSDGRKQTSNKKQEEKEEEDPPWILPKPRKERIKRKKGEQKGERQQGKGGEKKQKQGQKQREKQGSSAPTGGELLHK